MPKREPLIETIYGEPRASVSIERVWQVVDFLAQEGTNVKAFRALWDAQGNATRISVAELARRENRSTNALRDTLSRVLRKLCHPRFAGVLHGECSLESLVAKPATEPAPVEFREYLGVRYGIPGIRLSNALLRAGLGDRDALIGHIAECGGIDKMQVYNVGKVGIAILKDYFGNTDGTASAEMKRLLTHATIMRKIGELTDLLQDYKNSYFKENIE